MTRATALYLKVLEGTLFRFQCLNDLLLINVEDVTDHRPDPDATEEQDLMGVARGLRQDADLIIQEAQRIERMVREASTRAAVEQFPPEVLDGGILREARVPSPEAVEAVASMVITLSLLGAKNAVEQMHAHWPEAWGPWPGGEA